ncbi:MAG: O-methyltransferase [Alicyclobacillus sp.]|nr:O-methyltransferase [Alicyclobacillus sp.]
MYVDELLDELWRTGQENDANPSLSRDELFLNITPDTGELLELLACSIGAKRILELGTSNGYSTLWLAKAVLRTGGHVTTVDNNPKKTLLARDNFVRVGMQQHVTFVESDILEYLRIHESESFDFIFLDADRPNYTSYFAILTKMLDTGGLWVTDNVLSHAQELTQFMELMDRTSYMKCVIPVGKGELVALSPKS